MLSIIWPGLAAMRGPAPLGIVLIRPNEFIRERKRVLLKIEGSVGSDLVLAWAGAASENCQDQDRGAGAQKSGSARSRPGFNHLLRLHRLSVLVLLARKVGRACS